MHVENIQKRRSIQISNWLITLDPEALASLPCGCFLLSHYESLRYANKPFRLGPPGTFI